MTWERKLIDLPACYRNVIFVAVYSILVRSMWQSEKIMPLTMHTYYSPSIIKLCAIFLIDSEHWSIIMLKVSFQNVSLRRKKSKKVFSNVLIDDSLHLSCCQGATVAKPINMQFWELWKRILVVRQIQKALFLPQKLTLLSVIHSDTVV